MFTDSIDPQCSFTAFPCKSYDKFESGECFSCSSGNGEKCGQLGYYSDKMPGRDSLFLMTREDEPFCGNFIGPQLMDCKAMSCLPKLHKS